MYWCAAGIVTPCENFLHHNIIYADCTNIGVSDRMDVYDNMIGTNVTMAYDTYTPPHTEEICSTPGAIKFYFWNIPW